MRWQKVALIGVGLLGGSLGLALRERRLAGVVAGFVRRPKTLRECKRLGVADEPTLDLKEALQGAELVVLCTPIAQMGPLARQMAEYLEPGTVVTDVGSVKAPVVQELAPLLRQSNAHFVGAHPMAGSEKTGVGAARADLFLNTVCVITPTPESEAAAVRQVMRLWKSVGSRVLKLSPQLHDELVSRSSHLPHVVAAQLAHLVLDPNQDKHLGVLCANGFRDTTRIASGSPEMWRDICLANRKNLLLAIDAFVRDLSGFKRALKQADAAALFSFFEQAKVQRDRWSKRAQSGSPE